MFKDQCTKSVFRITEYIACFAVNTETEQYTYRKTVEGLNPGVISRLHMIDRVNVVLNGTVVDSDLHFNNLCGSHLQS